MRSLLFLVATGMILTSCSEPPKPKEEEKPPEPVTGRYALQQMYIAARTWAQDLQIASMTSLHFSQVPEVPGKAGGWQATFVSPSLRQSKTYTWAAAEISMSIHKGIRDEAATAWSGSDSDTIPIGAVKIDTDEAYQTAAKKLGKYAEDNPKMPITYQLTRRGNVVLWRVIWGESAATSSNSVLVDASTGQYAGTLH